jgi:hypothetical protein
MKYLDFIPVYLEAVLLLHKFDNVILRFIYMCKQKWRLVFHDFHLMLNKTNVLKADNIYVIHCRYFCCNLNHHKVSLRFFK